MAIMQKPLNDWSGVIRVLVVDDDQVLVRSLQRVLSLQGFEVEAASDGRSALARLQANEYDVMLLDLRHTNALFFKNAGTGRHNMVYRRADGSIGWVEPS